ncbi:unnamed protein product [Litomosoides sigmodontis]|uniref:Protein kinase domain-containing protein n=1 Tax=Litomosoides sigmodontis TaxID=42156 RepID=A0A3P6TKJ8_LITSI|nr:unnamed protein product [Litomosoides sigmodontis]
MKREQSIDYDRMEWTFSHMQINLIQFAVREEELILCNSDSDAIARATKTTVTFAYPWDSNYQTKLMNDSKEPNFIKFYEIGTKHQSKWEAYIYQHVEKELRLISGVVQIYHSLIFTDKCLTVQEFTAGTLKEFIKIQNSCEVKLSELIFAIIVLDLMKILRSIHQMNIIHGCFKSDNIFVAKRIARKPQLDTLSDGTTLLVKLANWEFAIRNTNGMKYSGQYINEKNVITDGYYMCEPWNYEIDRMGLLNVANELICNETLRYIRRENGRYIPLLNLKSSTWSTYDLWSDLFYKCLNVELYSWDELINVLAQATDTSIRESGDQWIRSTVEYNALYQALLKKNSQFYP